MAESALQCVSEAVYALGYATMARFSPSEKNFPCEIIPARIYPSPPVAKDWLVWLPAEPDFSWRPVTRAPLPDTPPRRPNFHCPNCESFVTHRRRKHCTRHAAHSQNSTRLITRAYHTQHCDTTGLQNKRTAHPLEVAFAHCGENHRCLSRVSSLASHAPVSM